VNTGLAIANPNSGDATINFFFTDSDGTNSGNGILTLGANQQIAKFLDQDPFNAAAGTLDTFTFSSSVPGAVVALRGFTNERSEFLTMTLPVAPLTPGAGGTIFFPHFADGDGWKTDIVLVNPTDTTISGNVQFLDQGSDTAAVPLVLDDGTPGAGFAYSIPARSARRFKTSNPAGATSVGSVRATPAGGSTAPSGLGIFFFVSNGITVSEAGVPALPEGTGFRVYAEASGTPGEIGVIRSGVAITNVSNESNTITLEITNLDGSPAGAAVTLSIPPAGQTARFIDELFTLPSDFSGILRISSTSSVAVVGLRSRVNQRGDFMITTTPPTKEAGPAVSSDLYFPHLDGSDGWSTQFVLFSGTAGQISAGLLHFLGQGGERLEVTVH